MRPRYLSTPLASMDPNDKRTIVNGIAIGAGVAIATELVRFGLEQARVWLDAKRAGKPDP